MPASIIPSCMVEPEADLTGSCSSSKISTEGSTIEYFSKELLAPVLATSARETGGQQSNSFTVEVQLSSVSQADLSKTHVNQRVD